MTKLGVRVLLASDVLASPQQDMTPKVTAWNRYLFSRHYSRGWGFLGGVMVKNLPANAGNVGLIPESGRSLGKGMTTHSSILAWEMLWMEEPGGLQSTGLQKSRS